MAMGRRKDRARTPGLWIATNELPRTGGHPFYQRLNQVLDAHGFDEFVEAQCAPFYADDGRPAEPDAGHVLPAAADRVLRRASTRSAASPGGPPIRWRCAASWAWVSTRRRRSTRRFRGRGG